MPNGWLTMVLLIAKVMPAWLGATSAWVAKWPAELQAESPIDMEINLLQE